MRLLADENVPLPSIYALRSAGMEFAAVTEDAAGAGDHDVLALAERQGRVLLTFDRDFGELVFRRKATGRAGRYLRSICPAHVNGVGRVGLATPTRGGHQIRRAIYSPRP